MNYTYDHYQTALAFLHGVGPRRARALLAHLPSLELLFTATPKELAAITELSPGFFQKMRRSHALERADTVLAFHEKHRVSSLFYQDKSFPRRLNQCADAPTQLFLKGHVDLNQSRFVAIVGTRSATQYGQQLCRELIASFQNRNIIVVSGLALGIDAYVHRYCLEYDVPTIGVLGHGLDRIYPAKHRSLAKEMVEKGALITEFAPGVSPDRENFPKRNRIVAGMCDATIVVESKTSGGSLITANIANGYNRDVFAFPGPVYQETSQGCNGLIANAKAHLLQTPSSFAEFMQWDEVQLSKKESQFLCFPEISTLQQEIVGEIQAHPKIQLDVLAAQLALPISSLQVELLQLRLAGIVEELPGKQLQLHQEARFAAS
ncbi:MAG: DNA-processing protein DprA [Crocinitomicaceae bacterium]